MTVDDRVMYSARGVQFDLLFIFPKQRYDFPYSTFLHFFSFFDSFAPETLIGSRTFLGTRETQATGIIVPIP